LETRNFRIRFLHSFRSGWKVRLRS
jgi:hypothetical protein